MRFVACLSKLSLYYLIICLFTIQFIPNTIYRDDLIAKRYPLHLGNLKCGRVLVQAVRVELTYPMEEIFYKIFHSVFPIKLRLHMCLTLKLPTSTNATALYVRFELVRQSFQSYFNVLQCHNLQD